MVPAATVIAVDLTRSLSAAGNELNLAEVCSVAASAGQPLPTPCPLPFGRFQRLSVEKLTLIFLRHNYMDLYFKLCIQTAGNRL